MFSHYEIIQRLTSERVTGTSGLIMLNDFAQGLGWQPSDPFYAPHVQDIATAHLVVEHGLENTAVLSFLRSPNSYSDLDYSARRSLLALSYNNLVDWHIQIGAKDAFVIYNRVVPKDSAGIVATYKLINGGVDNLRSEAFEELVGKRPNPNLPALDNALIDTISGWKRKLSAEMDNAISNEAISVLFNGIILARAVEDYQRRQVRPLNTPGESPDSKALLTTWNSSQGTSMTIGKAIVRTISQFLKGKIPRYLLDEGQLKVFDSLDPATVKAVFSDFYQNVAVPYAYDFSVMSKHALSRIYEHYVSILRTIEQPQQSQLAMFPRLPEEEKNKSFGGIYTPQFIARFFAKFLQRQMPPNTFRNMTAADPACGSGIFIRTLLETKFDPVQNGVTTAEVHEAFKNVLGLDWEINAAQATRLSLALLSLALTGSFPSELNVIAAEGIEYFQQHGKLRNSQEAVLANPPFVALETQPQAIRERIAQFMSKHATGRIDSYLAFLRIGFEMVKPGGFGLFVLPHSFLLANSANEMRKTLSENAWIRCLADLSAIRVFGDTGSYIILLIFQKKPAGTHEAPPATIVKCQDMVGRALQDALDGRQVETPTYSVYEVGQDFFDGDDWVVVPPTEAIIKRKFERFARLEDFLEVREGFISGADDIFVISQGQIPEGEEDLYVPYLPDRDMKSYRTPTRASQYFLFPFINDSHITENELKKQFPRTWKYLQSHKERLSERAPVRKRNLPWWRPVWPRSPKSMMRPKIVTPHLVLVPRFSFDSKGRYAVSHSPFMYPKETGAEKDLLRYFVAVLNSSACYWHIATHSHIYQRGYAMLEKKTLNKTRVPDPASVPTTTMRDLLALVDRRLSTSGADIAALEQQIDEAVAGLYGLTQRERRALGM
jgi:hypothetical protein